MSKTRRVFTTEFKQECVNLVVNQGYTMSQAASAMQVGLSSMQRWTRQYKQELRGITPQARLLLFIVANDYLFNTKHHVKKQ